MKRIRKTEFKLYLGIGYTNVSRIMRSVRQDGVILKPSLPAIPIDSQFVSSDLNGAPANSSISFVVVFHFIVSFLFALLSPFLFAFLFVHTYPPSFLRSVSNFTHTELLSKVFLNFIYLFIYYCLFF